MTLTFCSCPKVFIKVALLVALCSSSCKREPNWVPAYRHFLDSVNRDLEAIEPTLAPDVQPQNIFVGLSRLENALDRIEFDISALYQRYPKIPRSLQGIEMYAAGELKRLRINMQKISGNLKFWYGKLKHRKEFIEIGRRIVKKVREIDNITR